MINLVWLVPLFPFIGFLITGLGRQHLGKSAGWIASAAVLASFIVSVGIFLQVPGIPHEEFEKGGGYVIVPLFDFIQSGSMHIPFAFQVDALSSVFLLVITGVGFLIHIYSISYMGHDDGYGKFFAFLNLFIFSMLLLVLGANYVIMFIGWEGVGLCSYLLIGFWYKNNEYTDAAKKAFIMNRIGDLGFLIGIFLLFSKFNTLNFSDLQLQMIPSQLSPTYLTAVALCFFIGAVGKSAQIPLFTWLPDAMAGPTPVSALIHAATMVTAGVYMIARSHFIYTYTPFAQHIILVIGLTTALVGATIAMQQNDIKKVLAYSTVSQLGFMFMALGAGAYVAAIFHVITHAFFKALLFLGSGSVIHALEGEQDIRKMGGLRHKMPITFYTFLIGCVAISGIPPLSGFFSKDEILMHVFTYPVYGKVFWAFAMLAALMTAIYMFRLLFITFFGGYRGIKEEYRLIHESPSLMTVPLIVLAVLSVIGGFIGLPEGSDVPHLLKLFLKPVLERSMVAHPEALHVSHSGELVLMIAAIMIGLLGALIAWLRFKNYNSFKEAKGIARMAEDKWYFDEAYNRVITKPLFKLSAWKEKAIEKGLLDAAVNGVGKLVEFGGNKFRLLQSGMVGFYMFMIVLGVIILFALQIWLR